MKAKTESIVAEQSIIRGTSLLSSEEMDSLGSLIVVTGPSGVGKGTVTGGLLSLVDKLEKSVSVTTRPMREGEIEGKDYFFRTEEQFSTMRKQGEFLEYAEFAGFHYGTPESWVEEKIKSGIDVILEIEVQGAMQVRESCPDAVLIFLSPLLTKPLKSAWLKEPPNPRSELPYVWKKPVKR